MTNIFYLIREESGTSATDWKKIDLSSALLKKAFAGQPEAQCCSFEVGQNVQDGSLGMAMAIRTNTGDRLFLCLGNSNQDTAWADSAIKNLLKSTYSSLRECYFLIQRRLSAAPSPQA